MTQIEKLIQKLDAFRDERNWKKFHNLKDLSIALNIETSELLELFLWKSHDQVDRELLEEELADVFAYTLMIAGASGLNLEEILIKKIEKNQKKYPVTESI